ncbi:Homeodomain-like superfamily protein [Perilla frutescens var. hirtella]|uniref:Homeodomain-like superfamily protein n=1 Tax=Perilla frutescens var. hirtella TaxID=608512 RepID=A0AAD4JPV9_PERFH|nr:Homeodomain-like superfamily protein [Perilla frutescens var. hirtella]
MALEQLSLGTVSVDGGADGRQPSGDGAGAGAGDEGSKTIRLPRWTRQEILVLIQGKRVAENRVRRGRASGSAFGSVQIEPKWASISSYCKRHGVNRGPVQCRKRWSNLAGDYKKIKEWESKIKEETESFWVMRNDLRRERKLPGFFDREVYDILDGGGGGGGGGGGEEERGMGGGLCLALAPGPAAESGDGEPEALFDSGRSAAVDDGLFSDFEQSGQEEAGRSKETPAKDIPGPTPISVAEKQCRSFPQESPARDTNNNEKQACPEAEIQNTQGGRKRKRSASDGEGETTDLQHQLVEALEKNGRLLSTHLEAQNTHLELDREQRNGHVNSLITVLNKLADALGRIADKL